MSGEKMPVLAAYSFAELNGLASESTSIRDMSFPRQLTVSTTALRRGMFLRLFRERALLDAFVDKHWSFGSTPAGKAAVERHISLIQALKL